jgi:hypothetical protein
MAPGQSAVSRPVSASSRSCVLSPRAGTSGPHAGERGSRRQRISAPVRDRAQRAADEEIRELLDRHEEQRWQTLRAMAGLLEHDLPAELGAEEAADRLYALLSHDVLWLLVHRRGWTASRWRQFVTDEAARQLLPVVPATA